jgi:hypothetical protein
MHLDPRTADHIRMMPPAGRSRRVDLAKLKPELP